MSNLSKRKMNHLTETILTILFGLGFAAAVFVAMNDEPDVWAQWKQFETERP
jgi:hypothetical protein